MSYFLGAVCALTLLFLLLAMVEHRHRCRFDIMVPCDLRADEPGGPRSYHDVFWRCACGAREYRGYRF